MTQVRPAHAPTRLIVDDQPDNIRVLGEIFQKNHRILWATSGERALHITQTQKPDLILLDIMMPHMDGYTVFKKLQENPETANIPVIFVTALEQEKYQIAGLEMGAIDYLTKPIHAGIAKLRVRNHLELKFARDRLEKLATIDGLTGIANRRHFDKILAQEWMRSRRAAAAISLLMIDIDKFKAYNDHYGHQQGDTCLKRIATTLQEQLERLTDFLARYGGEEFVCLLPETGTKGLAFIGEKLRQSVQNLKIPHAPSSGSDYVTISVGGGVMRPDKGLTPEALIEIADRNLYRAKSNGRNQVQYTADSGEHPS